MLCELSFTQSWRLAKRASVYFNNTASDVFIIEEGLLHLYSSLKFQSEWKTGVEFDRSGRVGRFVKRFYEGDVRVLYCDDEDSVLIERMKERGFSMKPQLDRLTQKQALEVLGRSRAIKEMVYGGMVPSSKGYIMSNDALRLLTEELSAATLRR